MAKIKIMEHPLIQHKIGIIRRKETSSKGFVNWLVKLQCLWLMRQPET